MSVADKYEEKLADYAGPGPLGWTNSVAKTQVSHNRPHFVEAGKARAPPSSCTAGRNPCQCSRGLLRVAGMKKRLQTIGTPASLQVFPQRHEQRLDQRVEAPVEGLLQGLAPPRGYPGQELERSPQAHPRIPLHDAVPDLQDAPRDRPEPGPPRDRREAPLAQQQQQQRRQGPPTKGRNEPGGGDRRLNEPMAWPGWRRLGGWEMAADDTHDGGSAAFAITQTSRL